MIIKLITNFFKKEKYLLEVAAPAMPAVALKFATVDKLADCLCEICEFAKPATICYQGEGAYDKYLVWNGRALEQNNVMKSIFYGSESTLRTIDNPKGLIDYCLAIYGPGDDAEPGLRLNGQTTNYFKTREIDYWHGDSTYKPSAPALKKYLNDLEMPRHTRRAHEENPNLAYEISN